MPSGGQNKKKCPEILAKICELLMSGTPIQTISELVGVETSTISTWRLNDTLFDKDYSRAQRIGFEVDADRLKTIADEYTDVNKARLTSDNYKWLLARRAPDKYGDRISVDLNQSVDIGAALKEAKERVLPINQDIGQNVITQVIDITGSSVITSPDMTSDVATNSSDTPEITDPTDIDIEDILK